MSDQLDRIVTSDPLLDNAEAEWFKRQFESLAASHGFPIAPAARSPEAASPRPPGRRSAPQGLPAEPIPV